MDQKELEIALSKLDSVTKSKAYLEQYPTPPSVAAALLYRAALEGDITGKDVADLGCGNGIFAIGSKILGAKSVTAIDVDADSIEVCKENMNKLGLDIKCIKGSIEEIEVKVNTVIMNPPFGSQVRNSDIPFIEWSLRNSQIFYVIMNARSGDFLENYLRNRGEILWKFKVPIEIKRTYSFHRRERINIDSFIMKVRSWQRI
ncbi:MAG: METTL5 family protein [Thermoplasmatales archaeon]